MSSSILSDPYNGVITVDAVAAAPGFTHRVSFTRAFSSVTGLSPTQFRRNRVDVKKQEVLFAS